jgi:hypothetical protein
MITPIPIASIAAAGNSAAALQRANKKLRARIAILEGQTLLLKINKLTLF